jgi:hypothetical protein
MKTSQVILLSLALGLGLTQAGCKVNVTADGPVVQDNPVVWDIALANGNWSTGCYVNQGGFASEETLNLDNGNFAMTGKYYKLNTCTAAELQHSTSSSGRVVIIKESDKEPGSYEADLEVPLGGGATQIIQDLVRLESGKLYLGDHMAPYNGKYPSKVDMAKVFSK